MRIEFTKLKTSNKNIYVDFNNGEGWKEYTVTDAKENGINIPDNCTDFSKIKIKGKTDVFSNADVITSIKPVEEDIILSSRLTVSEDSYGNISYDYEYNNGYYEETVDYDGRTSIGDYYLKFRGDFYQIRNSSATVLSMVSKLDTTIIGHNRYYVAFNFKINEGKIWDRDNGSDGDPRGVVKITSFEENVGGTATIEGNVVNFVADSISSNPVDTSYRWVESEDVGMGDCICVYNLDDEYFSSEEIMGKLRITILESDPHLYMKTNNGGYIRTPFAFANN